MSRIGKKLILLPKDVEVKFFSDEDQNTSHIEITGSHGTISQLIPDGIQISLTDDRKLKVRQHVNHVNLNRYMVRYGLLLPILYEVLVLHL